MPIHNRGVCTEPSLRNEVIRVMPKDVSITVYHGGVDAYPRSCRKELSGDLAATNRNIAWHCQSNAWVKTHPFFAACVQIWKLDSFIVSDERIRELARC
tara:strand:- start:1293 stop:1589 length:297 start_codon:yes stop_codon:yes gene_type:complete